MNRTKSTGALFCAAAILLLIAGVLAAANADKKKIIYITNGIDPFWNVAAAGVRAAGAEFKVETEVLMPPKGIVDQKRMIETALVRGVDGIAIRRSTRKTRSI